MEADDKFYNHQMISKLIDDLNAKYSTEMAELVDMNYSPKPELQRLNSAQVIAIDSGGLRLVCNYHRWEMTEQNDRMFHKHTDETKPHSTEELLTVIEQMIQNAKASYLNSV